MADVLELAAHLAQGIGARPGGTEEEQQASFFIEETMNQAGLATAVEEFNCNPGFETAKVVCCVVTIVAAILSMFLPLVVIPAFIATIVTAVLFALDILGKSPIGKSSRKGISQNVVGRYVPGGAPSSGDILLESEAGRGRRGSASRKRKIILVAHYDSGKVRKELNGSLFKALPFLPWVEVGGMVLVPVMLLVRMITNATGALLIVLNVLTALGAVAALITVAIFLMDRTAAYTDGANNNASGVAVMLEVARRIASSASEERVLELGHRVDGAGDLIVMHGEDAAIASGMLPVETDLIYEEALSGSLAPADIERDAIRAQDLVDEGAVVSEDALTIPVGGEVIGEAEQVAVAAEPVAPVSNPRFMVAEKKEDDNVPDWFKKGIAAANAKKNPQERPAQEEAPARSRFSDALDAAAEASEGAIEEFEARDAIRKMDEARNKATSASSAVLGGFSDGTLNVDPALSKASSELQASIAAKVEEVQAVEAEAFAQAIEDVVEQADQADRTISFIPVAADIPDEIALAADAGQSGIIAKTPEEILAEATAITEEGTIPEAAQTRRNKRRAISLPSLTGAIEAVKVEEETKVVEEVRAEADDAEIVAVEDVPAVIPSLASDTMDLPSVDPRMEHVISSPEADKKDTSKSPAPAKKPRPKKKAQPIEPVAPVAEQPQLSFLDVAPGVGGMANDDIIIDDVDDSAYEVNTTVTGAPAGPAYVEMPKSRGDRLRGIFGRKKKQEETSFADAIGIDADYDARTVGKDRGGWESFQNESADYDAEKIDSRSLKLREKSWDDGAWDDDWNGGAFSLGRKGRNSSTDGTQRRKTPGDMLAEMAADAADEAGSIAPEDMIDEREQIRSFRTSSAPLTSFAEVAAFASSMAGDSAEIADDYQDSTPKGFQTEVWFVALGAELTDNAGMKAFLAEHEPEMRGAVVIDIEAMGAGELSVIDEEGILLRRKAPSRMKRYVTRAASALGMHLGSAKMNWCESAAYLASSKGMTSIHVAGIRNGKPAYMGEITDTIDNLSEEKMLEGAAFTLELLHLI